MFPKPCALPSIPSETRQTQQTGPQCNFTIILTAVAFIVITVIIIIIIVIVVVVVIVTVVNTTIIIVVAVTTDTIVSFFPIISVVMSLQCIANVKHLYVAVA